MANEGRKLKNMHGAANNVKSRKRFFKNLTQQETAPPQKKETIGVTTDTR
jgi:hypothetical protein